MIADIQPFQMFTIRIRGRSIQVSAHEILDLRSQVSAIADELSPSNELEKITTAVCAHYNITRSALMGRCKSYRIAWARHVAAYLARTMTARRLSEVGHHIGRRDHGTIINSVKRVLERMDTEPHIAAEIATVKASIQKLTINNCEQPANATAKQPGNLAFPQVQITNNRLVEC
jgi:chromosomal replication initiator protein